MVCDTAQSCNLVNWHWWVGFPVVLHEAPDEWNFESCSNTSCARNFDIFVEEEFDVASEFFFIVFIESNPNKRWKWYKRWPTIEITNKIKIDFDDFLLKECSSCRAGSQLKASGGLELVG